MKTKLAILVVELDGILLTGSCALVPITENTGKIYYLRADGLAANKEAATSAASAATAMNVATHNGETFVAGDIIKVSDAGGEYKGASNQLIPPSSGSVVGGAIVYEGVGTPVFDASRRVTVWVGPDDNGVYTGTLSIGNVDLLIVDGIPQGTMSSDASCPDNGHWYYTAGDWLHVNWKPTTGFPGDYDVSFLRIECELRGSIHIIDKSHLTIKGINFRNNEEGILVTGKSDFDNINIQDCNFEYCNQSVMIYPGTDTVAKRTTLNNLFSYRCRSAYKLFVQSGGIKNYHTGAYLSNLSGNDLGNLTYWGNLTGDREFVGCQNIQSSNIYNLHNVNGEQIGLYLYTYNGGNTSDNTISKLYYKDTVLRGIILGAGDGIFTFNNNKISDVKLYGHIGDDGDNSIGIYLGNGPGSSSQNYLSDVLCYGNGKTAADGGYNLYIDNHTIPALWTIKNCSFSQFTYRPGYVANSNDATLIMDYNNWYNDKGIAGLYRFYIGNPSGLKTFAEWQGLGYDIHGFNTDGEK